MDVTISFLTHPEEHSFNSSGDDETLDIGPIFFMRNERMIALCCMGVVAVIILSTLGFLGILMLVGYVVGADLKF